MSDLEKRLGLVLEGGGMRGIYSSGVLDEFLEQGVKVDGLVGVSAGILHGVTYVSEQIGRNVRYMVKYRGNKRFMSLSSLIKTGNICETEFCYHEIPEKLYPSIEGYGFLVSELAKQAGIPYTGKPTELRYFGAVLTK